MTYAFLTDGLDREKRAEIDKILEGAGDRKSQAKRERDAIASLMKMPRSG